MLMNTILFKFVGVPLNGSVPLLFASGLVFVLAYQAIGVAISALLSNLRLSLSIGGGYSVLAFTFSGLTFPFLAMDLPVRIIGYVFPLTRRCGALRPSIPLTTSDTCPFSSCCRSSCCRG